MTLDISDMHCADLYTDRDGNVYRVVGYWNEPVVQMEMVLNRNGDPLGGHTISGGISGLMWEGFKRIKKGANE